MTDNSFDIRILDSYWMKNVEEQNDLCLHGHVFVKIGNEIISNQDSIDITLNAAALYLMRTLKRNYKKDDFELNQLLPCCGHSVIADNEKDFVIICGCLSGIDWTISHTDNNKIKHTSENGSEAIIDKDNYNKIVLDFADQVENFYKTSLPKIIPTDDLDRKGYLTFWKEWNNLRNEWR